MGAVPNRENLIPYDRDSARTECPECKAAKPRMLAEMLRSQHADYFHCDACHLTYSVRKGEPGPARPVNEKPKPE